MTSNKFIPLGAVLMSWAIAPLMQVPDASAAGLLAGAKRARVAVTAVPAKAPIPKPPSSVTDRNSDLLEAALAYRYDPSAELTKFQVFSASDTRDADRRLQVGHQAIVASPTLFNACVLLRV